MWAWFRCHRGLPDSLRKGCSRVRRALRNAGLRKIRFHELRHTFATVLIQGGESSAYVKDKLGHRKIR
ncbi:MAG: tyrosine-type recombinase/integrase [Acidobacteriota bacterium]